MAHLLTRFDQYGAVRITKTLWLILAYGLRHVALILFPPTRVVFEQYADLFAGKLFLISDGIIFCLILLYTQRAPEASNFTRAIWRHGLWLLTGAYALDTALTLFFHTKPLLDPDSLQFGVVAGSVLINAFIIAFVLMSGSVREVFLSFPEPLQTTEAPEKQPEPETPVVTAAAPTIRRTRNIPDAKLLNEPITPGYQYANFPFQSNQVSQQILEIRHHLANSNLPLAEKGIRFLLNNDPLNPALWHELGLVAFSADKLEQAESMILKALLFDSTNYLYWRNLGEIRRRQGYFYDAIENARQAIKLMPTDVNAHYNLGLALWDAGRNEEALVAFEQAKKLHPDLAQQATN